jgi:hypothetical protein
VTSTPGTTLNKEVLAATRVLLTNALPMLKIAKPPPLELMKTSGKPPPMRLWLTPKINTWLSSSPFAPASRCPMTRITHTCKEILFVMLSYQEPLPGHALMPRCALPSHPLLITWSMLNKLGSLSLLATTPSSTLMRAPLRLKTPLIVKNGP